jgi:glycosyltransferase involved in cell wall biosynthesis
VKSTINSTILPDSMMLKKAEPDESKCITIVIPALNEEQGILKTISAIPKEELTGMGYEIQVLVVDNGSQDRTGELAREVGAEVVVEPRRGYGRAYKTGFEYARGQIIATADADHTYPVENIHELVRVLEQENLDFITTNRFGYYLDGAMSFKHKIGNNILNLTTKLLFLTDLKDSQSGMWVFRKELLNKLQLTSDSMAFSQELKIKACCFSKCKWKEIPIVYRNRVGKVKLRSLRDGTGNLLNLMIMRLSFRGKSVPTLDSVSKLNKSLSTRLHLLRLKLTFVDKSDN